MKNMVISILTLLLFGVGFGYLAWIQTNKPTSLEVVEKDTTEFEVRYPTTHEDTLRILEAEAFFKEAELLRNRIIISNYEKEVRQHKRKLMNEIDVLIDKASDAYDRNDKSALETHLRNLQKKYKELHSLY